MECPITTYIRLPFDGTMGQLVLKFQILRTTSVTHLLAMCVSNVDK